MLRFLKINKKIILLTILVIAIIFSLYLINGIAINAKKTATSYVATGHFPTYPTLNLTGKTALQITQIRRGEYLAKAGDCIACHTNPKKINQPFAGGLPMQTPFGVIYTPNITPDNETGIGLWNDEQFLRAFREGISPEGHYYYPAFPYIYYNKVTVDDALAIKSYLDAIPAINQKNRSNCMMFPFNWRFLQLPWRMMFFYPERTGAYVENPNKSSDWNKGAYLVEGLGHCAMCHTPSYNLLTPEIPLGAPIKKYNLTGAVIEGYLAPNISKSNIGAIPSSELLQVFTQYHMIGGGKVQGPMYEAIHDSLQPLTTSDLLAMITYLKTVDSVIPRQPNISPSDLGKVIYNNYCSGCHNTGVGGAPRVGDKLKWETLERSGIEKLYTVAINGGGNMPAMGTCITCGNYEIRAAVDYMLSASKANEKQIIPVSSDIKSAEQLYQTSCASCHSNKKTKAPQLGDMKAWAPIEKQGFINTYQEIMTGKNNHPANAGCTNCSDKDILTALKYMLQKGSQDSQYLMW